MIVHHRRSSEKAVRATADNLLLSRSYVGRQGQEIHLGHAEVFVCDNGGSCFKHEGSASKSYRDRVPEDVAPADLLQKFDDVWGRGRIRCTVLVTDGREVVRLSQIRNWPSEFHLVLVDATEPSVLQRAMMTWRDLPPPRDVVQFVDGIETLYGIAILLRRGPRNFS